MRGKKMKNKSNSEANSQSVFLLIYYSKLCSIYIFLMEIGLRSNFSLKHE